MSFSYGRREAESQLQLVGAWKEFGTAGACFSESCSSAVLCALTMASSLHLCALSPSPTRGFLSPSCLHYRPGLAIRPSVFPTVQAPSALADVRTPSCTRPGRLAAASGDEAPTAAGGRSLHELQESLPFNITRLEQYTEKVKNEVLRVHAVVDGEEDQVIIFKGFSSSLMRPTAYDPSEPVLPPSATIRAIDRIRGPFNPAKVLLIKGGRGLSWQQFQTVLEEKGL